MKKSMNLLIEELADDLQPGRHWHPVIRAGFWAGVFVLISTLGMLSYQSFRPHFFDQMLEHSRFSIEMLSIFLFSSFLIFSLFNFMVPGRKSPNTLWILSELSLFAWIISQYLAFGSASPKSSIVGARSFCVEEVLVYGLIGMGFLFYFVWKARFPFKVWQCFLMGLVSGLIPGALMQLACMYSPKHGLILHYTPAVFLGLLAAGLFPLIKRFQLN